MPKRCLSNRLSILIEAGATGTQCDSLGKMERSEGARSFDRHLAVSVAFGRPKSPTRPGKSYWISSPSASVTSYFGCCADGCAAPDRPRLGSGCSRRGLNGSSFGSDVLALSSRPAASLCDCAGLRHPHMARRSLSKRPRFGGLALQRLRQGKLRARSMRTKLRWQAQLCNKAEQAVRPHWQNPQATCPLSCGLDTDLWAKDT